MQIRKCCEFRPNHSYGSLILSFVEILYNLTANISDIGNWKISVTFRVHIRIDEMVGVDGMLELMERWS